MRCGMTSILLVSGSPRRRELLDMMEVSFEVYNADIDESRRAGEEPEPYATAGRRKGHSPGLPPGAPGGRRWAPTPSCCWMISCWASRPTGLRRGSMLEALAGRRHQVITAVALATSTQHVAHRVNRSWVDFAPIPEAWIEHYSQLDEPMDKAGAYAIQGLAAQWVRRL